MVQPTRHHHRTIRSACAALAVTALAATACGSSEAGTDRGGKSSAPAPQGQPGGSGGAEVATAKGTQVAIFHKKGDSTSWKSLTSPNDYGAPRVFLVEQNGGDWLKVRLPIRPNGSTGWIKTSDVTLHQTTRRLEIDPKAFRFTAYDGDQVLRAGKVATGTGGTPTPPGRFFFTELVQPKDANSAYGAYAYGLSGFSPTLTTFAGGPGQLAVHGTNAPGQLGSKASHGCVRVSNDDITWIAKNLGLGTPVVIKPS